MATKVEATVKINGTLITPVSQVGFTLPINGHSSFQFSVKVQETPDIILNKAKAYLGKEAEIVIDSPKAKGAEDVVFKGIILDLGFSNHTGGTPELIFSGHGPTILLEDGLRTRSFTDKSLKDIVSDVLKPIQLKNKTIKPQFSETLAYTVQYEESNFNFLARQAMRYGEWFFYDGEALVFGELPGGEAVNIAYGNHISSFDLGLNIKPASFEYAAYNYEKHESWKVKSNEGQSGGLDSNKLGKEVLNQSKDIFGHNPLTVLPKVKDKGFLKTLATSTRGALENRMVVFNGNSDFPKIKPGSKITVKGQIQSIKKAKSAPEYGTYIVTSVSHSAGGGSYQNSFTAIPADIRIPPANSGVRQPVSDPQIGIVKYNDDEKQMGRVKVQLPWQKGTPELTPWIRVTTPYAGDKRGLYVLPELEEEVWVDFDWNDPERPHVVGSFYHGKAKPDGEWFDKDNNKKVFRTKAGNQIEIMDKSGKEEIKIFNPKEKNIIKLSLDGEAQITIETEGKLLMKAKDIEMESETLSINASKTIDIETKEYAATASKSMDLETKEYSNKASQKMELKTNELSAKANQKLEMKTMQMTLDGGQKLEMKGLQSKLDAASAEVKASAKLDLNGGALASLKGALVKIN